MSFSELDVSLNFQHDLLRLNYSSFDASQQEERCWQNQGRAFTELKIITEKRFRKNGYFL